MGQTAGWIEPFGHNGSVEAAEVRKLADLEDSHWWYAERRSLLAADIRDLSPGVALDVGAAGGGNTRVLRSSGWAAVALEYGQEGAAVAQERGLVVIRGDAERLPVRRESLDLVVAFDVLEHLGDDLGTLREIRRVLRPGGTLLVAVPAGMELWSAHDEAVGHVRRYSRGQLVDLVTAAGLTVQHVRSWNVLLRPAARWRRRRSSGSDLQGLNPALNFALRATVALERVLPLSNLPGVSLVLRATRPTG